MMSVLFCFAVFCFGTLSSAGVFTVLSSVGLIPRFVGKTRSAGEIRLYENMVVLGTVLGGIASMYLFEFYRILPGWLCCFMLAVFGIFSGIFVGCLALAIAEMLDSIPIFFRRIKMKRGIGAMVISIALGKVCGSLIYFFFK